MEEVQHTDKCCSWDDPEFCDCGARAIASLEQQLTAANAEIATLRHDLCNEQAASRMAHEVVARNRALEAENAQLRHALANAQVAAGFAKEMAGKVKGMQERIADLESDSQRDYYEASEALAAADKRGFDRGVEEAAKVCESAKTAPHLEIVFRSFAEMIRSKLKP